MATQTVAASQTGEAAATRRRWVWAEVSAGELPPWQSNDTTRQAANRSPASSIGVAAALDIGSVALYGGTMSPEQIIALLRAHFPDARCDIVDLTGTKDHYELHIASEQFRGLSQIAVHRLVYSALGAAVGTSIHALSVKACLPERWAR